MLDKVLFHSLLEALFLIDKLVLCNSELIGSDRMLVPQDDGHSKEEWKEYHTKRYVVHPIVSILYTFAN